MKHRLLLTAVFAAIGIVAWAKILLGDNERPVNAVFILTEAPMPRAVPMKDDSPKPSPKSVPASQAAILTGDILVKNTDALAVCLESAGYSTEGVYYAAWVEPVSDPLEPTLAESLEAARIALKKCEILNAYLIDKTPDPTKYPLLPKSPKEQKKKFDAKKIYEQRLKEFNRQLKKMRDECEEDKKIEPARIAACDALPVICAGEKIAGKQSNTKLCAE